MLVKVFIDGSEQFTIDTHNITGKDVYIRVQEMINRFLNDYVERPVCHNYNHFNLPYKIKWIKD